MTGREKLAASIIDTVCDVVERTHPELKRRKGEAVLYGTEYHDLEAIIAERILSYEIRLESNLK